MKKVILILCVVSAFGFMSCSSETKCDKCTSDSTMVVSDSTMVDSTVSVSDSSIVDTVSTN
jgi:hypothetical protein